MREHITLSCYYNIYFGSFSRFQIQDEHNASCFFMSAAQRPPKNRCKNTPFLEKQEELTKKMYFCPN